MRRSVLIALAVAELIAGFALATSPAHTRHNRAATSAVSHRAHASTTHKKTHTRAVRHTTHAVHHTSAASRYESELHARYEEGYKAGFAAGLKAHRAETGNAGIAPRTESSAAPTSTAFAGETHEEEPLDPAETEPRVAEATVTTTRLPAADVDNPPARSEGASLLWTPGPHQPPVTLKASLHMLHEPYPAALRGSLESLQRQNSRLDAEGLQRVEDDRDLEYRIAHKLLVPLPASENLTVNPKLPQERRYCRPWTAQFLTDLARMHEAVFHRPLRVDSAVRTVKYQRRLVSINANAAPAEGAIASPHETGATIDIGKRGMTWREIGWMRRYLLKLQDAGFIDVEEEFYQACFHITVYDTYGRRMQPAPSTAGSETPGGSDRSSESSASADGPQGL